MTRKMKLLFWIGLLPLSASAEKTLSWNQALELTSSNNPELRAARESLNSAESKSLAARGSFLPQISGHLDQSKIHTLSRSTPSSDAYLKLSQNLFRGFQDSSTYAIAQSTRRSLEATLAKTQAKVSADLKKAYQGLVIGRRGVILAESIRKRRERNARLVELRFQDGRENRGSFLLAQAYAKQAEYEALQSANQLLSARAELARVLGLDVEEWVPQGEIPLTPPSKERPDFRELARGSPQRRETLEREVSTHSLIQQNRGKLLPELNFSAQTGRTGREFFPDQNRWSYGLSLSLPLFTGGRNVYELKSALASQRAATLELEATDRSLLERIQTAWNTYTEASVGVEVAQSFLHAAETRAEIARNKYNTGLISFEDWDLIETDLITREKAYLSSLRARVHAEADWEQLIGQGVLP